MSVLTRSLLLGVDVLMVALSIVGAIIGGVALADHGDRGCASADAAQCSDAQSAMAIGFTIVAFAALWLGVRIALRLGKPALPREGAK